MPEPNEDLEQNCTIRIHLIIDSARQKIKNKETGRYSNSSYQASRVLICTWTAAIILGSPLPSAAKCTTSHQPHGARLKATLERHPFSPASVPHTGREGTEGFRSVSTKRGASPHTSFWPPISYASKTADFFWDSQSGNVGRAQNIIPVLSTWLLFLHFFKIMKTMVYDPSIKRPPNVIRATPLPLIQTKVLRLWSEAWRAQGHIVLVGVIKLKPTVPLKIGSVVGGESRRAGRREWKCG